MATYGAVIGILFGILIYFMLVSIVIFFQYPTEIVRPESYFSIAVRNLIELNTSAIIVFIIGIVAGVIIGFFYIPI